MKKNILFLCTGNSCRSQMAEGFGKSLLPEIASIQSAGVEAHGVNPNAVSIMAEVDVDISQQQSKVVTDEMLESADHMITLCGDARDRCPTVPTDAIHLHWDLPDPAKAEGSEEERTAVFRSVRDEIKQRILILKETL